MPIEVIIVLAVAAAFCFWISREKNMPAERSIPTTPEAVPSAPNAADLERAAAGENDWVRARILKNDPPMEGSLLQIAERARRMANDALGQQHQAHGAALLNLGLYYDLIEQDEGKAAGLFDQARAVLDKDDAGRAKYAEAFHIKSRADRLRKQEQAKRQATAEPDNAERQQILARSYMDMAAHAGSFPEEVNSYSAALPILQRLADAAPNNQELQRDLAAVREKVAALNQRPGPWMDTLDEYCVYFSRDIDFAKANPTATGWEQGFANGIEGVAKLVVEHRDYYREHYHAPQYCQTPPEVCERLAAFAPKDIQWLRRLADAYEIIGDEQHENGESYEDELPSLRAELCPGNSEWPRRALALRKRIDDIVAAKLKRDAEWEAGRAKREEDEKHRHLVEVSESEGDKLLSAGKNAEALASYQTALAEERWFKSDGASGNESYDFIYDHLYGRRSLNEKIADLQLVMGDIGSALDFYRPRIEWLEKARKDWPNDGVDWINLGLPLAELYCKIGDGYHSVEKPKEALSDYRASLAICEHVVATFLNNPEWNRRLAEIRERVDATTRQLAAAG